MKSEARLAWALADAVSVCFIAVRNRYPLPTRLISAVAAWLDCYIGSESEPTTRDLLNRVDPQELPG